MKTASDFSVAEVPLATPVPDIHCLAYLAQWATVLTEQQQSTFAEMSFE